MLRFAGLLVGALALAWASMAQGQDSLRVTVTNPTEDNWENVPVVVPVKGGHAYRVARAVGHAPVAVQVDDLDGDGTPDEMVFPAKLDAGETATFELGGRGITDDRAAAAHAGMYTKTPERRGFEGPGWESDLVAFRIYWDKRNATDVFCKTTPTLSLENLARSDVDYHHLTPWGMDVLKVGNAVGIGGFGAWIDGKVEKVADVERKFVVRANGPHRAVCDLVYKNWKAGDRKLDLTARMKICGGQDYVDCDLFVKALDDKPLPELICGFVKHTSQTELVQDPAVAMVGRWGNQALGEGEKLMGGDLGLAIMAEPADAKRIAEDDVNHLIILKPARKTSYRYWVDWYKDPQPAASIEQFEEMMRQVARKKPVVRIN